MRHRPPSTRIGNDHDLSQATTARRASGTKKNRSAFKSASFVVLLILLLAAMQIVLNSVLHTGGTTSGDNDNGSSSNHLRRDQSDGHTTTQQQPNWYDVLLKNTINYNNLKDDATSLTKLQQQINNLQSEITTLESKSQKYADDPRFFPFVIRDSRHLTPVQIDPDFHVFDYVDLTQAMQPKSKHSQLLHNARLVVDEVVDAKRLNATLRSALRRKASSYAEKHEAPCQKYSIECYRQKVLQVFSYILREFPSVEYYFYVEADNDLCVPMTMVRDLALKEKRYFINTGIGFSGWIMSREFLGDFIELYENATLDAEESEKKATTKSTGTNDTRAKAKDPPPPPEIRPDVLASYYLTDKRAWTVTRQYWVSHTTLESLGIPSLTVKDRRKDETGERMKLDKHLPRCLEPRRGKWKISRRRPYLDPRDRFGWDYFDYDVCPNEIIFPCGGQDQLKQLVEDDWRVANETGALAKRKILEEKRQKMAEAQAKKAKEEEESTTPKERLVKKAKAEAKRIKEEEKSNIAKEEESKTAKELLVKLAKAKKAQEEEESNIAKEDETKNSQRTFGQTGQGGK